MTPAPTKPSEALRAAWELLTPEGAWIQGDYARDASGRGTWPDALGAKCWCSLGALKLCTKGQSEVYHGACSFLKDGMGGIWVDWFNDDKGRTQAEVLAAFSKAIALAEEAGQ